MFVVGVINLENIQYKRVLARVYKISYLSQLYLIPHLLKQAMGLASHLMD